MSALKPSLQLRLGQQLTMTPQLQQAIRLLQLPILELQTQLQEILEKNVMLEAEDPDPSVESDFPSEDSPDRVSADADSAREDKPDDAPLDNDDFPEMIQEMGESNLWSEVSSNSSGADPWSNRADRQSDLADESAQTLREQLLWQLEMEKVSQRELLIGQAIIDSINDDGYLVEPLDNILTTLPVTEGFTVSEIESTLERIQGLEPVGVGARSLSECISIQLRQLDPSVPGRELALKIAAAHLDLVAEQHMTLLRRALSASDDELEIALALVRSCHPRPGSAVQSAKAEYVVPDVFVVKHDGRWIVEINSSMSPRLRVNQTYAQMLRGGGEHSLLRTQLQEARWLVRSLEIRNSTLLKVAMCIVERQANFFEHGEESMKPMTLRDVANAVEMHESTISRVTANKYMRTPRGVLEFRYFFSSQLSGDAGTERSSTAIRAKIRKLINQEAPGQPLSDSRLAELLAADGVQVARRTVAKYREAMKIAPSSERKRRPGH